MPRIDFGTKMVADFNAGMNVTIKDVPAKLHKSLKARAKANKRSLNWEVIEILEKSVESRVEDREKLLQEIDGFRATLKVPPLTEDFLNKAKSAGRR